MTATFRNRALFAALLGIVVAYLVWNTPALDFIAYPLRLFVTLIHEAGHGLTALLTGGRIDQIRVFPNGSGVATTAGGARWLILPAGYLGAALFGAGLFVLANRVHHTRQITAGLGIFIGLIALVYTPFLSTAWLVGLAFGVALLALARFAYDNVNLFILNVLAAICALNAVFDLFSLVNNSDVGIGAVRNDAAAFAREFAPFTPAWLWAIVWSGIAIALMIAAVYFGLIQPHRRSKRLI